jgi:hypothetical protein
MSSSDSVPQDARTQPHQEHVLSHEDVSALDALFDTGLGDASRVFSVDSRAGRAARLLSLLDGVRFTGEERETLVQATMARVSLERHRRRVDAGGGLALTPDDEDALEALVSAEFQLAHVPSAMRERAARHMSLLGLLDAPVPGSAGELVETTLARLQESIESQEERLALPARAARNAEWGGALFSFVRSRELVSVAALLVIATAMLTPLAQYAREYSRRTACASSMAAAGVAFAQYAGANQDRLPLASASRPGNLFWNVGKRRDQSNSANLFVLRSQGFAKMDELSCAGQVSDQCRELGRDAWDWPELSQVSFSYQNMFARERPSWSSQEHVVVLADASPVIRRAVLGQPIYPFENSANHGRRGQNVLWSDGTVQWLDSPVLPNHDNIWLPRPVEDLIGQMTRPHEADPLHGTESPSAADDAFVGP